MSATALLWLIGRSRPGQLIEVRWRRGDAAGPDTEVGAAEVGGEQDSEHVVRKGMRQRFFPAVQVSRAARFIELQGQRSDVYVGAAPRETKHGGKGAVGMVWSLWADCDSDEAVEACSSFEPAPRYVVASGSGGNVHAWWPLKQWITRETAEGLNRRLAFAIGADMRTTDASRILRPPGTFNHKHDPPSPVRCVMQAPGFINPQELANLPKPTVAALDPTLPPRQYDSLLSISPRDYIEALTGQLPDRGGKVTCPFHAGGEERTPSLHVYPTAERGWRCFGCETGGTIYDFAANLWGLSTRGDDFKELARRLREEIGSG